MSRARFWASSTLLALLVWGIGLVSAAVVDRLPDSFPSGLMFVPPGLAVLLIGVWAADHWWTRGALLIAVPPAAYTLVMAATLIALWAPNNPGFGFLVAFMVLGAMSTVQTAVAAVVAAALGVWIGQRRTEGGHA